MTAVRTCASDQLSLNLVITRSTYVHYDSPIQVVIQSLLHLGAHAHLQHLTIRLSQDHALLDKNPWNELQDLPVGTRFPALRSVEFRSVLYSPNSIPMAIEPLIAAFPRIPRGVYIYMSYTIIDCTRSSGLVVSDR